MLKGTAPLIDCNPIEWCCSPFAFACGNYYSSMEELEWGGAVMSGLELGITCSNGSHFTLALNITIVLLSHHFMANLS